MHGNTLWDRGTVRWARAEWLVSFKKGRVWAAAPVFRRLPRTFRQMEVAVHHVPGSNDTYYIPDFVTTEEEIYLLRQVSLQSITHVDLILADSGDASAQMEATVESEVCYDQILCQQT